MCHCHCHCLLFQTTLASYPASLVFPTSIMHPLNAHIQCYMHLLHKCHRIEICPPPVKQYITTHRHGFTTYRAILDSTMLAAGTIIVLSECRCHACVAPWGGCALVRLVCLLPVLISCVRGHIPAGCNLLYPCDVEPFARCASPSQ